MQEVMEDTGAQITEDVKDVDVPKDVNVVVDVDVPKDVKVIPTRPPPPKNATPPARPSAHSSSDRNKEKLPPKRPRLPSESLTHKVPPSDTVQQHLDQLRELQQHKVRWFFKEGKKWTTFCGKESLEIEAIWQCLNKGTSSDPIEKHYKPAVRGKLYEVDVNEATCTPVYWKGNHFSSCIK